MTREMNVLKIFLFFGIGVLVTLLVGLLAYGCAHDAHLFFIYGKLLTKRQAKALFPKQRIFPTPMLFQFAARGLLKIRFTA